MANSVDPDQTTAVYSGPTMFASLLNSSVMLGNYLQQTTSADDIFRYIFFLCALSVRTKSSAISAEQNTGAERMFQALVVPGNKFPI